MKIQLFLFLLMIILLTGCQPSQRILEDSKKNATPEPTENTSSESTRDDFEDLLKSVQTGNFEYIYAFRRKDAEVLNGEDKKFLKENSPGETNQRVLTSDGKAVIMGSNYLFTPENLQNLKKRFEVKDYSRIITDDGNSKPVNTGNSNAGNSNAANIK